MRVHGYGVLAWEWREGLRNWAVPLLLAAVMRVGGWFGLRDPWVVRGLLAVPLWALQAWGLVAAVRLGRRRAGELGGWVAAFALGLSPAVRGGRGANAGGGALGGAAAGRGGGAVAGRAPARERAPRRRGARPGVRRCVTARCRRWWPGWPGSRLRRRWLLLGWAAVGLGAVLLALGALDWASWGVPWRSVWTWFRFNVGSSGAAQRFGAEPPGYYWPFLWSEVPLWVWPSLLLGLAWLRPRLGRGGGDGGPHARGAASRRRTRRSASCTRWWCC